MSFSYLQCTCISLSGQFYLLKAPSSLYLAISLCCHCLCYNNSLQIALDEFTLAISDLVYMLHPEYSWFLFLSTNLIFPTCLKLFTALSIKNRIL